MTNHSNEQPAEALQAGAETKAVQNYMATDTNETRRSSG